MDGTFKFKGYFRPGYPFGDTLRYLESSEDCSMEDAVIHAFTVFYYPKILQKLSLSSHLLEKVTAQSVSYCRHAIADLDKLENTINNLQPQTDRVPKLKRRSISSQYFFELMIDTTKFKEEFRKALEYFESGQFGDVRFELGQAVSGIFHPLASNAYADPLNQVVNAIHCSRTKFRGLLVDLSVDESMNVISTPALGKIGDSGNAPQKSKLDGW